MKLLEVIACTKNYLITKRNSQASEARQENNSWLGRNGRLQVSLRRYALLMEDKMAAEAFGCSCELRMSWLNYYQELVMWWMATMAHLLPEVL